MNNQAAQTMPALPRPYWKAGEVKDDFGNPYNETDLFTDDDMRAMYQQGYAAALSQTAGVAEGCGTECEKCGREAVHYLVMDNLPQQGRRMPFCEYCTREHEETAREVNDHEMRNFGGTYGLVAFHYEPLAAAPAASGGEDELLEWISHNLLGDHRDYAMHVLKRGGTGDAGDLRSFVESIRGSAR